MANISTSGGVINIISKKGETMSKDIGDEIIKGMIDINDNWYYGFDHVDYDNTDMLKLKEYDLYYIPSFYGSGRWNFGSTIHSVMNDEEIKNMMSEIMTKHGIETLAISFYYDDYEQGNDWIAFNEYFMIEYIKTEEEVKTTTSHVNGRMYRFSDIASSEKKLSEVLAENVSFFDIEEFTSVLEYYEEIKEESKSGQQEEEIVKEETPTTEVKEEENKDDK